MENDMKKTQTVLMCVLQWLDGDCVRVTTVGWDEAGDEQRATMRREAIQSTGLEKFPELIQSVRFVEIEMPIVEAIDPATVTVTAVL